MNTEFNLDVIDKSFTRFNPGQLFEGVVILKRTDGVVFNIGGKSDSFISREDFENYENVKVGDRFKVVISGSKNEEGLIIALRSQAEKIEVASQAAEKIKLGSKFSFVSMSSEDGNLISKLGEYKIIIPNDQISNRTENNLFKYKNKQLEAIATEIDNKNKVITGSVKLQSEQEEKQIQNIFWNSIYLNKIVNGTVVKIMPYGAFVNIDGVDCLVHISDIAHERVEKVEDYLKIGEKHDFKVVGIDKENKKISLSLKQLSDSPRLSRIKELERGKFYDGTVIKMLPFGAIVKLENGAEGLLHLQNATNSPNKRIYEIVKLAEKVRVKLVYVDLEKEKISFAL